MCLDIIVTINLVTLTEVDIVHGVVAGYFEYFELQIYYNVLIASDNRF